jgi:hypothetical protein
LDHLEHEVDFSPLNCAIGTRRYAQESGLSSAARFARKNLNPAWASDEGRNCPSNRSRLLGDSLMRLPPLSSLLIDCPRLVPCATIVIKPCSNPKSLFILRGVVIVILEADQCKCKIGASKSTIKTSNSNQHARLRIFRTSIPQVVMHYITGIFLVAQSD